MIKSYFERSVEVELVETKFFPKLKFDAIGSWKMSQKRRQIKVGEETELIFGAFDMFIYFSDKI